MFFQSCKKELFSIFNGGDVLLRILIVQGGGGGGCGGGDAVHTKSMGMIIFKSITLHNSAFLMDRSLIWVLFSI